MALEPRDSADIAKAIVTALEKAMKTFDRSAGGIAGGVKQTDTRGQQSIKATKNQKHGQAVMGTAKNLDRLQDAAAGASKSLGWLTTKVDKASIGLNVFAKSLGFSVGKVKQSSRIKASPAAQKLSEKPEKPEKKSANNFKDSLSKTFQNKSGVSDKTMKALGGLGEAFSKLGSEAAKALKESFTELASRGYGTTDSLFTLYGSAIKAGMSLKDYAKFMDDNMIAISRASSFVDFQNNLKIGTDSLAKFGIFGEDAAKMAGSMMSSSTALGVPQKDLISSMESQTAVFAKLRKTTNITADGFENLIKALASDTQIRTEMSALAPADRQARQSELIDQMAYAKSLNLSSAEQDRYTQSILAQRKTTVKSRFQQGGRLTQAAGMLGMGGGQVDELRRLAMNKYKTTDEQIRYQDLLGTVNTGLEKMQQSGQPGSQFQADSIIEMLKSSGVDLDSAAAIRAAKESGDVKNQDIGKSLSKLDQTLGKFMKILEGISLNPLAQSAIAVVGAVASIALAITGLGPVLGTTIGTIAGSIIAARMGGKGAGDFVGPPTPNGMGNGKGPGKWGKAARFGGKALGVLGTVAAIGGSVIDYSNAEEIAKAGDGDVGKVKGGAVGEGLGSAIGTGIGIALTPWTGGLSLLITPLLGILGAGIGKWVGGLFGAEKATDKNTKETKKNSEELVKARRAQATSDTVALENINSLGSSVLSTGIAYSAPGSIHATTANTPIDTSPQEMVYDALGNPTGMTQASLPSVKQPIVSPATQTRPSVNPGPVNKASEEVAEAKVAADNASAFKPSTTQDAAQILAQILAVLQQSLSAENQQVDLSSQLLRAQALIPRLPDNQYMVKQVFAQT